MASEKTISKHHQSEGHVVKKWKTTFEFLNSFCQECLLHIICGGFSLIVSFCMVFFLGFCAYVLL